MYNQRIYDLINLLEEKHLDCYFNISKEYLLKYVEEFLNTHKKCKDYKTSNIV